MKSIIKLINCSTFIWCHEGRAWLHDILSFSLHPFHLPFRFGVWCAVSCFLQLALSSHFIQRNSGGNNLTAFVACWYYSLLINCAPGRATGEAPYIFPFTPRDKWPITVFYRSPSAAFENARGPVGRWFYCAVLFVGIADRRTKGQLRISFGFVSPRCSVSLTRRVCWAT